MKKFIFAQTIFALIIGAQSFALADSLNKKSPSKPGLFAKLLRKVTLLVRKTERKGNTQHQSFLPLEEVLKNISEETGITFILADSVSDQTVFTPDKTNNWKSTVKQLLRDYNTLQIWSDDLAKSRIWIFEEGQYNSNTSPSAGIVNASLSDRTKKVIQTPTIRAVQTMARPFDKADIRVTQRPKEKRRRSFFEPGIQRNKVTIDVSFNLLPPHIRHDPEVLRFLHSRGVKLPEDIREKYGENMEYLPPERPMFRHVRNHPLYKRFLQAKGL
jgi:hypothetical protein|tara:strand:+ start:1023 stop:1838 length:816 start_codon:yes stop_codon:yes gene_type:complete